MRLTKDAIIYEVARFAFLMILVMLLTFWLLVLSPIDPLIYYTKESLLSLSADQLDQISMYLELDMSIATRFVSWLSHFLHGELGYSVSLQQPVAEVLQQRIPLTLRLMLLSWIFTIVFGYSFGILAAMSSNRLVDLVIRSFCFISASSPGFWVAILFIGLFGIFLEWAPVCCGAPIGKSPYLISFQNQLPYLALPVLVLVSMNVGHIIMHTREKTIQVLESEHVFYAHIHKKSSWFIFRYHVFKSTLGPAMALQCASLSELLGGSVLIESVFSYPGIAQSFVVAGLNGDLPLLMAVTLLSMVFVYTGNLLSRLSNAILTPKGRKYV